MGHGHWSTADYDTLRHTYAGRTRDDIFQQNRLGRLADTMNPYGLGLRESRDSDDHPLSQAIAVFLDVTGSMGAIPEQLIRHKLGDLMETLVDHHVPDAQLMFSALGDHYVDRAPLQVGQFESGTPQLNAALASIYLEGGGGGQNLESYLLAWLIGGYHTSIDCWEKRRQKGFLFTVGDEKTWDQLEAPYLTNHLGYRQARTMTASELLAAARRQYHVFHIHINETHYRNNADIIGDWRARLGQHLLILDDHNALAELIATVVALTNGAQVDGILRQFDPQAAGTVRRALPAPV